MRILYCVLNWGLGHATRSIPVIKALLAKGHSVDIASDGGPLIFLQKTFPDCTGHALKGYNIQYPTRSVFLNVLSQTYKMLLAVRKEHQEIDALIKKHRYDAILSDNRYGCYHSSVPSLLITHQLSNLAKSSILSVPGEWILNSYVKSFDEIWIPDTPDRSLSGKLTETTHQNVRFIGHLSDQTYSPLPKQYAIAAILSGPEPQRTKLEREVLSQFSSYPGSCILVRGVINNDPVVHKNNVTIYPYLDRRGVNALLNSSDVIFCRTGYSSLMDLLHVGTRALLVPTPGQPEQIYLGERLRDHPQFVVQKQGKVDMLRAMHTFQSRNYVQSFETDATLLRDAIHALQLRIL